MIADKAIAQISEIICDCGFAVEVVHQDYGDDLLVQTKVGDEVDPSKIWIQVKGTQDLSRFRTKKDGYSLRVSEGHAFKWVRNSELVVVVIWDVNNKKGLWSIPGFSLSEWDFRMSGKSHTRLCFADDSVFNSTSMNFLAWLSRSLHYEGLLARSRATDEMALRHGAKRHRSMALLISFDFLVLTGIIIDDGLDEGFCKKVRNGLKNGLSGWNERTEEPLLRAVLMLCLLDRTDNLAGFGLPPLVLSSCSRVLEDMISKYVDLETGKFVTGNA